MKARVKFRIVQQPDGRWLCDIRGTLPNGEDYRTRRTPKVTSYSAAERWAQAHWSYKCEHPEEAVEAPTLAEFYPRFWKGHVEANDLKPSQCTSIASHWEKHLEPLLGETPLDEIDDEAIQTLKGELKAARTVIVKGKPIERERKPKTINNVVTTLRTMLRAAHQWKVIKEVPQIKLIKSQPPEMKFYDFPTFDRLCTGAKEAGPMIYAATLLGGRAGLRAGEMAALRWSDVDLKKKEILVQRAIWRGHEGSPKGGRSRRIPIAKELAAALEAIKRKPQDRVLHAKGLDQVIERRIAKWLERAQELAGLPAEGNPHRLRHTFASHLVMLGADLKQIQELLGHADLKTTLRYAHLTPEHRKTAIDLFKQRPAV